MNSLERVAATIAGLPRDRPPFTATLSLYGAALTGCDLPRYYSVSEAYVEGQCAVADAIGPDVLLGPFALALFGAAFGSSLHVSSTGPPTVAEPAATTAAGVARLATPDLNSNPYLCYLREALRTLSARFAGQVPVAAIALDPTSLPMMIMGMEAWISILAMDRDEARRVLDVTVPFFVASANAAFADGALIVVLPMATLSQEILSNEMATERVMPVLHDAFARLDGPVLLHHAAGSFGPLASEAARLPNVAGLAVGAGDSVPQVRRQIGPEPLLLGNIDGPSLGRRDAHQVRQAAAGLFRSSSSDPKFVLATGSADVALDTPIANILAFREAAEVLRDERTG